MKKRFNFVLDHRVRAMLSCSAAVLLTACGGSTSGTDNEQPIQTAAYSANSATNESIPSEAAIALSAPATADIDVGGPGSDLRSPAVMGQTGTGSSESTTTSSAVTAESSAGMETYGAVSRPTTAEIATDSPTSATGASGAPILLATSLAVKPSAGASVGTSASTATSTGTSTSTSSCNYYIAPNGSDSSPGTLAAPWKTIKYGSAKLTAGKTLCARGGTYYGQAGLIWKSSGTASAPVTFKNYPGEKPVFDGQWGDTGVDGDFLVFSNNSHVVVDGITIQHFADKYGNGAIDLHNGQGPVDDITIQNSTLMDNGSHTAQDHHIYLATGVTNVTIRNNLFIRAAGSAIQAYHSPASSGIKIYNNVMIGGALKCSQSKSNPCPTSAKQHWGLIIGDAKSTQIYNNTIYGMQYGIDFNYGTTSTGPYSVRNNLIINSTAAGIRVASAYAPYFTSDYNGFFGNSSDINWKGSNMSAVQFAAATTNERHAVRANPNFVNAAGGDFHLNVGSPAIDKGVLMTLFNTDKDGVARVNFDIGAYEKK